MIRNVIVHVNGEQPLLADLYELPKALDQGLLCTNVRLMDGKRPVFIERSDSIFFFPYLHIRFVEVLAKASGLPELEGPAGAGAEPGPVEEPEADLELDEDFLRRVREA